MPRPPNAMEQRRRALIDEVCGERARLAADVARLRRRNTELLHLLRECRDRLRGCSGIPRLAARVSEALLDGADGKDTPCKSNP